MKKILVIDDESTSVRLLQSRLELEGFDVIVARDGDVGLEKVQTECPDLVVLDVEMPRMNGYFFISELRKINERARLPVIVLSSHKENISAFTNKGVVDYIIKPIDFDKLLQAIRSVLD
ncbi:MAG: response regulator [Candidatus Omnitrophota bacterium]